MNAIKAVAWFAGIVVGFPLLLGIIGWGAIIGAVIGTIGSLPGFNQVFTSLGIFEDQDTFSALPIRVEWGDGEKLLTVNVANLSGEAWERFAIKCPTNRHTVVVTDTSGILPGETGTRTYGLGEYNTTITQATGPCTLDMHRRGKPKEFDPYGAHDYGDGGWGDRVPSGSGMGMDSSYSDMTSPMN